MVSEEMEQLHPPPVLSLEGNLSENWRKWHQRYTLYETASGLQEKTDAIRGATFLHCIGQEALDVYNTFTWAQEADKVSVAVIVEKFQSYCSPKKNVTFERHIFNTRAQQEGETSDQYVTELKRISTDCEFGDLKEGLIRDRIVCGIRDDGVRARLLREGDLTLQKAIDICRASELSSSQVKMLTHSATAEVHAVKKKPFTPNYKPHFKRRYHKPSTVSHPPNTPSSRVCPYCGGEPHNRSKCPASNMPCHQCKKLGHFKKMCQGKPVQVHELSEVRDNNFPINDNDTFVIGSVEMQAESARGKHQWFETVKVNGQKVNLKVDSGSEANIINLSEVPQLKNQLQNSTVVLRGYGGYRIQVEGQCWLTVSLSNGNTDTFMFQVVKGTETPSILGLLAAERLGLIQRPQVSSIHMRRIDKILQEYQDVFGGVGCLEGFEYEIKMDPTVTPVINPPRQIGVAYRDKVKDELNRLEDLGILAKEEGPTEWVSNLHVADKPNGKIRICIDPRDLNKGIKRHHYPMNTIEDVVSRIPGAKVFSVFDANQGFHQIKLAPESSKLTTFQTPFGRYRYQRLPMGISSSPEIFQRAMTDALEGLEKTECIMDDILVWGQDDPDHDDQVEKFLQRIRERGIQLNRGKSKIGLASVDYVGHTITHEGLKPAEGKVRAITEMPTPQSKEDLGRFLGLITYVSKFIPNVSEMTAPLRLLMTSEIEWHWGSPQQKSLDALKSAISHAPVLVLYDVKKPITLSVDASSKGIGAVLLQEGRPVAYASKALTPAQQNYAQGEGDGSNRVWLSQVPQAHIR